MSNLTPQYMVTDVNFAQPGSGGGPYALDLVVAEVKEPLEDSLVLSFSGREAREVRELFPLHSLLRMEELAEWEYYARKIGSDG